jgi:ParB family transcriptional regulator, chromosome partitioning protein
MTDARNSELRNISPDDIHRNEDNPRLFFRTAEMDALMASISRYGVQVPVTVYRESGHYVLIDGERRWRCARKLNLKSVPALVQDKPSPLQNLLLMFTIHALREQWDYFTIANKLPEVQKRFKKERGHDPNEEELSEATGLTRGQIRRCLYLLDLPQKYKDQLVEELSRPKKLQQISEDLFIEMERALRAVKKRFPESIKSTNKVRDVLIGKFRKRIIRNVTEFRMLSKIATSVANLGVKDSKVKQAIGQIFQENNVGIDEVFAESFGLKYDERKIGHSVDAVIEYLESLEEEEELEKLGKKLRERLVELANVIRRVVKG